MNGAAKQSNKPAYVIPSMHDVRQIPHNGLTVVSTFTGAGGSCLGYRLAGYKVLWANEFIEAARDTYSANFPDTPIDSRDIRLITVSDIRRIIGNVDIDVFEGSPPCASFSMAGSREDGWDKVKQYSDTKQRTDDLFFEFARLLKDLQPKVFAAENVSGLVKGTAKGYFKEILRALKACGYNVEARLLDAKWLGVPQSRQRIIFIGTRDDLQIAPAFPKPLPYWYSLRDAIPAAVSQETLMDRRWVSSERPANTVLQSGAMYKSNGENFPQVMVELERDYTDLSEGCVGREWQKLHPGQSSSKYMWLRRSSFNAPSATVTQRGGGWRVASVTHPTECRKFSIQELKRICSFPDDFILTGTFEQQWERLGRAVPPIMMQHIATTIRDEILCRTKMT